MSAGGPGLLAASLLRREVGGRAEHRADLGDARLLGRLGDAEVGELDDAVDPAQQVARLDVAVDDALAVGVVEPGARAEDDRQDVSSTRSQPRSRRISAQDWPSMYSITM